MNTNWLGQLEEGIVTLIGICPVEAIGSLTVVMLVMTGGLIWQRIEVRRRFNAGANKAEIPFSNEDVLKNAIKGIARQELGWSSPRTNPLPGAGVLIGIEMEREKAGLSISLSSAKADRKDQCP